MALKADFNQVFKIGKIEAFPRFLFGAEFLDLVDSINPKIKSLKKIGFFSPLILPALLVAGYYLGGANMFLIHGFVFVLVPLMDYVISTDKCNVPTHAVNAVAREYFYKFVTFLWVYVQLGVLIWAFYIISTEPLSWWEWLAFVSGTACSPEESELLLPTNLAISLKKSSNFIPKSY